ncbi:MAG: hypothetical protein P8Y43_05410 [Sulfurovaceae bacterium]|jgi:hypothetical protein
MNNQEKIIKLDHIIKRIKLTVQTCTKSKKIYDKDIALLLKLEPQYFAVIKKRGKIPYKELAEFCFDNEIDLKWMLYGETTRNTVVVV